MFLEHKFPQFSPLFRRASNLWNNVAQFLLTQIYNCCLTIVLLLVVPRLLIRNFNLPSKIKLHSMWVMSKGKCPAKLERRNFLRSLVCFDRDGYGKPVPNVVVYLSLK